MSKAGFPDVIVIKDSEVLFFEIKTEKDTLSSIQKHTIDIINKKKEIAFVIKDFETFKQIMEEL